MWIYQWAKVFLIGDSDSNAELIAGLSGHKIRDKNASSYSGADDGSVELTHIAVNVTLNVGGCE